MTLRHALAELPRQDAATGDRQAAAGSRLRHGQIENVLFQRREIELPGDHPRPARVGRKPCERRGRAADRQMVIQPAGRDVLARPMGQSGWTPPAPFRLGRSFG
jgi:hypothetical protein